MRLSSLRRAAVLTLATGALLGTSACFGSFNMTRKLYGFNKNVSKEKFVQELVFLGLNIVPVYSVAGFIDVIVANTVEFWTGNNPISMASTIRLDSATTVQRVVQVKNGVRVMTLKSYKFDKYVATTTVQNEPGSDSFRFATVYANGSTETHVTSMSESGKVLLATAKAGF